MITCPSLIHKERKETKALREDLWKSVISPDMLDKYNTLANSLLLFRCSSCHSTNSLDVGFEEESCVNVSQFAEIVIASSFASYQQDMALYCSGELNADTFYQFVITKHFTKLSVDTNEEAWKVFLHILKSIPDTERRVNLHLRYIRDRPRVTTVCCSTAHCFRCTTVAHDEISCLENEDNTDNSIVHCPACNISLVKGDGCDSVTCVCGEYFEWEFEKNYREQVKEFALLYPEDSHRRCVDIMCEVESDADYNSLPNSMARAWRQVHSVAVNVELVAWFTRRFAHCPAQCAVNVNALGLQVNGHYEAANLYTYAHSNQIERCRLENYKAVQSLAVTMYPVVTERAMASDQVTFRAKHFGAVCRAFTESDERITRSLQMGTYDTDNRAGITSMNKRGAEQFLYLFGNRSIQHSFAMLMTCDEPWRMLKCFLVEARTIKRVRVGLFHSYNSGSVSSLACDADVWLRLNNNDTEVAAERVRATRAAVEVVLSATRVSRTVWSLAVLGDLTWRDLVALLSWSRLSVSHEEEDDEEKDSYLFSLFGEEEEEEKGEKGEEEKGVEEDNDDNEGDLFSLFD
jgi:hypothetical protein